MPPGETEVLEFHIQRTLANDLRDIAEAKRMQGWQLLAKEILECWVAERRLELTEVTMPNATSMTTLVAKRLL